MNPITIEDLSLSQITLETLPRLQRLRDLHFSPKTKPAICTELPGNITRYLKSLDDPADSPELRAGKLYKFVMENKTPIIADENLLAGTTTTKTIGVMLYPDLYPLSLWPELETIKTRKKNPFFITQEDIDRLNFEIFPFWLNRNVMEVTRKTYGNPECQRLMERIVFYMVSKPETISHTIPNYGLVLKGGLLGLIQDAKERERASKNQAKKDFYKAVQLALSGIIDYARKLSRKARDLATREPDPHWRQELLKMSEICQRVPAEKPRTFREALNAIWICKIALHQESANLALSLGRLDQILYPFYAEDIKNQRLTVAQAAELVGCFWLKIADHVPMIPETGEELFGGSGSNQAITVGGVDKKGNDAVNDLTYVMLRVTELLKLRDPNLNARYYYDKNNAKDSRRYLERLCQVNLETKATPCFHNDDAVIETLQDQGVSLEHARDYGVVGCVEPTSSGRTFGHTGAILLNLTAALELALFGGKHRLTENDQIGPKTKPLEEMTSFSELKEIMETQLGWLIDLAVTLNNLCGRTHQQIHPTPMLSAMMEGCMEKGLDVIQGGATYNSSGATMIGLADVVDSLTAIEEFVFNRKKITPAELNEALENDWEGLSRKYFIMLKNSREKFGTGREMPMANAHWLMDFVHRKFQEKENYRGGKYTVGYWTMTNHAGFGMLTKALPHGRKAKEPFASGITPVSGSAPGLTSCLNFIAGLEHRKITNGQALNLKFLPRTASPESFAGFIEGYFKQGGLQVQFNVIDREKLLDACKPAKREEYKDLLVRVSGYTAYFVDLNEQMKKEIINRAEYDLASGQEVKYGPFSG